eukprot:83056-Pyramimonas_sp.AAC.1
MLVPSFAQGRAPSARSRGGVANHRAGQTGGRDETTLGFAQKCDIDLTGISVVASPAVLMRQAEGAGFRLP